MSLNNTHSDSNSIDVRTQISSDIEEVLKQFNDPKKGLRIISLKMGIHEKTLNRLRQRENRPSYNTLFRFYRYKFDTSDDAEVLRLLPSHMQDYLLKCNSQQFKENVSYTNEVDIELQKNLVWGEIYVLCAMGKVAKKEIQNRYGQFGIRALQEMAKRKILNETNSGFFELGENQASFGPETIVKLGTHLSLTYSKTEDGDLKGQNYMGFFAEGLSREAYLKWLEIDQDAYEKKVQIASLAENHGEIKAFTYITTDQMTLGENND